MGKIFELLAEDLSLSEESIRGIVLSGRRRYRKFIIKKNSGGDREIFQPSVELKPILYWLRTNLLEKLPVHNISTAFGIGDSIVKNARIHKESLYSIRIDISNFFQSIRPDDLFFFINKNKDKLPDWAMEKSSLELLSKCCFVSNEFLPIGYLTSPRIANVVMFDIDKMLHEIFMNENKYGNVRISRYADDFIFSTNKRGACKDALSEFARIFSETKTPRLEINNKKTTYMSRAGGSARVTGLRVNNAGAVIVHAKYRDHVRLLLKLFKEERLKEEDRVKLVGHLAHIQNVDPALFTKLSIKYTREISRLRRSAQI